MLPRRRNRPQKPRKESLAFYVACLIVFFYLPWARWSYLCDRARRYFRLQWQTLQRGGRILDNNPAVKAEK